MVFIGLAGYHNCFGDIENNDITQSWADDYERIEKEIAQFHVGNSSDSNNRNELPIMDDQDLGYSARPGGRIGVIQGIASTATRKDCLPPR